MALDWDDGLSAFPGLQHHQLLERLSARALTAQNYELAFVYSDRRCRIEPSPAAHCFVLRAEANWHLGRRAAALDDLTQALSDAPSDIAANRRMVAWANDERRLVAAANLVGHDDNPKSVRSAIAILLASGERQWAAVSVFDSHVVGWVAWTGEAGIEASLALDDGTLTTVLEADPFHLLASREVKAANFRLRRPLSKRPQHLILNHGGVTFKAQRLPSNLGFMQLVRPDEASKATRGTADVPPTIIVPVYADFQATRACFESLLCAEADGKTALRDRSFRILAVDDATPDPEIRSYLRELAATGAIELLVNSINLGFVGAINRAMSEVSDGDVILLNADVVAPPGFVERLAAAAHSAPDIGTATPLSNNGDIFSFPLPNQENPIPSYDQIVALDRIAATTNGNIVINVPSGIGFCLYITRACLDVVPELSESFERGYLEDVDFCLRARANGFRSVCSASVFVGHHGSRSFRSEKRGLVRRNLRILDQRFPGYRKECLAFESADPLRVARAAIELGSAPSAVRSVLIAAPKGAGLEIARARAAELAHADEFPILLAREFTGIRLSAHDGSAPQSILLDLSSEAGIKEAAEIIKRLRPMRLEVIDPMVHPQLIKLADHIALQTDFWITADFATTTPRLKDKTRLFAPTSVAGAFARARVPRCSVETHAWKTIPLVLPDSLPPTRTLAIVPASPSPAALQAIRALALRLGKIHAAVSIVVAGATWDDLQLMSFPHLFVTGKVDVTELADLLTPHSPNWFLTDFDSPLFGHPIIEATRQVNRQVAYRDWSSGLLKPRSGDLPIAFDADNEALADSVASWVAGL